MAKTGFKSLPKDVYSVGPSMAAHFNEAFCNWNCNNSFGGLMSSHRGQLLSLSICLFVCLFIISLSLCFRSFSYSTQTHIRYTDQHISQQQQPKQQQHFNPRWNLNITTSHPAQWHEMVCTATSQPDDDVTTTWWRHDTTFSRRGRGICKKKFWKVQFNDFFLKL